MKHTWMKVMMVLAATVSMAFGAGQWLDNYDKAVKTAAEEGKPILLDFTGSDWCGWCIKLDKEVFSKKEFTDYAKDSLVLMKVDFPQRKRLSKKIKEQNDKLQKKYSVGGYPTIILIDAEGKVLGQTGYQEGGAAKYVEHLKAMLDKKA